MWTAPQNKLAARLRSRCLVMLARSSFSTTTDGAAEAMPAGPLEVSCGKLRAEGIFKFFESLPLL